MTTQALENWTLECFYPYEPIFKNSMETGQALGGMFAPLPAKVPGSVYKPLLEHGIISDPYYDMDSLKCEWVKDRWWLYQTTFTPPAAHAGRHPRLRVGGADYAARIHLNGTELGRHANMYTPFVADIGGLVHPGEENRLAVLLENAPDEMGQIGLTSHTHTQKARFAYKWDWCPRMVHLGLHEPVTLEDFGLCAIEYARLSSAIGENGAQVRAMLEMTAFAAGEAELRLTLTGPAGETVATQALRQTVAPGSFALETQLAVPDPQLWYPAGHGAQPLYTLRVEAWDAGGLSDQKDYTLGLRTLTYRRCTGAPEGSLPYCPVVNGIPVYIKGANMTPLDMLYGDLTQARYAAFAEQVKAANINLLRVWGGGLIERQWLYDLCDRHGILIWQEFIQSSSGLDNVPAKDPAFLAALAATATEAVKTRRNHPCLAFFSGGNELMSAADTPATFADENIAMLKDIVTHHSPDILMLPTSASGPREFLNPGAPSTNHDVHGPWKYEGVEGHYSLYNRSDSQLHSEFGVDGAAFAATIRAVMPPAHQRAVSMNEDPHLRHHGEWWDTHPRDSAIFGPFDPADLETFVACSQFIQAEGTRYALQANRRRAFQNCGSIIWQLNEPWPNVSGTNLMDYHLNGKPALHAARLAYRPVDPCLRYDRLVWQPGDTCTAEVWVNTDTPLARARVTVRVTGAGGAPVLEQAFEGPVPAHSAKLGAIAFPAGAGAGHTIVLQMELDGQTLESHYAMLVAGPGGHCDKAFVCRLMAAGWPAL